MRRFIAALGLVLSACGPSKKMQDTADKLCQQYRAPRDCTEYCISYDFKPADRRNTACFILDWECEEARAYYLSDDDFDDIDDCTKVIGKSEK